MPTVSATLAVQAELNGAGGGWTAITADVLLGVESLSAAYGIAGGGPLDRIAGAGTMTFALNNDSTNSGGLQGYYSPGHANARSGWELGIMVRLAITFGGTTYYKFRGTVVDIQPDAGQYQRAAVLVTCVDWMDEAARTKLSGVAVQENKRADQIITSIVTTSVTRQPAATSYATGQSTFAIALDNIDEERASVLEALADVVRSEVGYLYVKGDTTQGGTLRFESRHTRPTYGAAAATFTNTMFELSAARRRDDIVNRVYAVVHPRKVGTGASTVLFELTPTETSPEVAPGETVTLVGLMREATGRFVRIGGKDLVTPAASTDYVANSAPDGSGTNLTTQVSVSVTAQANTVVFTLTNNASVTAYFTTLQVRGNPIQDTYEVMALAEDTASMTAYGEITEVYDMPYEDDTALGKGVADWIANLYADPRYTISSMSIQANKSTALMTQALAREPGDKITVTESLTGVSASYFINGVRLEIAAGGIVTCSWTLAPADQQNFWLLEVSGASELGTTTVLGFA